MSKFNFSVPEETPNPNQEFLTPMTEGTEGQDSAEILPTPVLPAQDRVMKRSCPTTPGNFQKNIDIILTF